MEENQTNNIGNNENLTNSGSNPVVPAANVAPQKKSKKWLVHLGVAILFAGLASAGAWFIQQSKINNLEVKYSELEKQLTETQEKLASAQDEAETPEETANPEESSALALDIERETDIKALHGHLEVYYADNGYYPSFANLNDPSFRAEQLKGLDEEALITPGGGEAKLAESPSKNVYSYAPTPSGCDNASSGDCNSYTLTAILEDGSKYSKEALN